MNVICKLQPDGTVFNYRDGDLDSSMRPSFTKPDEILCIDLTGEPFAVAIIDRDMAKIDGRDIILTYKGASFFDMSGNFLGCAKVVSGRVTNYDAQENRMGMPHLEGPSEVSGTCQYPAGLLKFGCYFPAPSRDPA
jgi:hypothetical protein